MKIKCIIGAVLASAIGCFSAAHASSITFRYSGEFTVDQAVGSASSLLGTTGSFFYDIDFSVPDPDSSGVAGDIPNAVIGRSITIGGETFLDETTAPLEINFNNTDGFNFVLGSTLFSPDISFGIITDFNPLDFVNNPLLNGQFGVFYGLSLIGPDSPISIVGAINGESGFFGAHGTVQTFGVVPEQTDPGNGQPPVTTIPVPAALPLLLSGLFGLLILQRRRAA